MSHLLGQGAQDGVHLFGHGGQYEFELLFGAHGLRALVAQVLQSGGDVDLAGSFGHSVQDHVDQTVGATAAGAIAKFYF